MKKQFIQTARLKTPVIVRLALFDIICLTGYNYTYLQYIQLPHTIGVCVLNQ